MSKSPSDIPTKLPEVSANKLRCEITVVEAKDLKGASPLSGGKCDPYVVLRTGNASVKTGVKKDTLSPIWNEGFEFELDSKEGKSVDVEVWDENDIANHTLVSCASIPLSDNTGGWFEMLDSKKVTCGQIKLKFTIKDPACQGCTSTSSEKRSEGGLLGFLQEYGWLVYIISLLAVIAYKYLSSNGAALKAKLPVVFGETLMKAGDFIYSETHHLALDLNGNLALFDSPEPGEGVKKLWESATDVKCPKCIAFLTKEGILQVKNGRKVIFSMHVSEHPDVAELIPLE